MRSHSSRSPHGGSAEAGEARDGDVVALARARCELGVSSATTWRQRARNVGATASAVASLDRGGVEVRVASRVSNTVNERTIPRLVVMLSTRMRTEPRDSSTVANAGAPAAITVSPATITGLATRRIGGAPSRAVRSETPRATSSSTREGAFCAVARPTNGVSTSAASDRMRIVELPRKSRVSTILRRGETGGTGARPLGVRAGRSGLTSTWRLACPPPRS